MYHKAKDSVTFNSQVQFWCKLSIGIIIFILLLTSAILQIIRNPKCFQSILGKSSFKRGSTDQNWSGLDPVLQTVAYSTDLKLIRNDRLVEICA